MPGPVEPGDRARIKASMGELRIGTSGWSYPTGKGTWNGIFYPPSRGRKSTVPGFDELTYYAEHFDTVEVNSSSTVLPSPRSRGPGPTRTPSALRVLVEALSEVHAPDDVQGDAARRPARRHPSELDALARVNQADIDEFKRGIDPLAERRQARRTTRAIPAQLQGRVRPPVRYLEWLLRTFNDVSSRRGASPQQLERCDRRHPRAA